eukprot:m.215630 g.215630  ORF g.215630 m.215630 type:complete len:82 (+) comp33190_c3_seq17:49-294(+)
MSILLWTLFKPKKMNKSTDSIIKTLIHKCKELSPAFDTSKVIHSFAGTRAKSTRGDWIIEASSLAPSFVHAAGIDSPGLAG